MKSIYEIRKAGREYCQTEGSEHYKAVDKLEPIDLIIAKGLAEDFCLANIIKYAARFKQTQRLEDLKKASDYAQILVGVKLDESHGIKAHEPEIIYCLDGYCTNCYINNNEGVKECRRITEETLREWDGSCKWRSPLKLEVIQ